MQCVQWRHYVCAIVTLVIGWMVVVFQGVSSFTLLDGARPVKKQEKTYRCVPRLTQTHHNGGDPRWARAEWRALARANISGSWLSYLPYYCCFFALASSHHCFLVEVWACFHVFLGGMFLTCFIEWLHPCIIAIQDLFCPMRAGPRF